MNSKSSVSYTQARSYLSNCDTLNNSSKEKLGFFVNSGVSEHFVIDEVHFSKCNCLNESVDVNTVKKHIFIRASKKGTVTCMIENGIKCNIKNVL